MLNRLTVKGCRSFVVKPRVLFYTAAAVCIGGLLYGVLFVNLDQLMGITSRGNCTGYYELQSVPFLSDNVRNRLCDGGAPAFTIVRGKFPLCKLAVELPDRIEQEVKQEAVPSFIISRVTGHNVTVMGYRGDLITLDIARLHAWEPLLVTQLIRVMKILQQEQQLQVSFLDVGSNIGVYSLQAMDAGFPTIAVDANIRNLIRMRLSARHMDWPADRLKLFWTFFHTRVSLRYLEFSTEYCNIGGASGASSGGHVLDTVPVMTAAGDDLLPHLAAPSLLVMKIDIETSERVFFETGVQLLEDRQVAVVQMEWWRPNRRQRASSSPNHRYLVDYFVSRRYALLSPTSLELLDPETFTEWDTLWVKRDFIRVVQQLGTIK